MATRSLGYVVIALVALVSTTVSAQQYPNRPVKIIAPTLAGGAPDVIARLIAQKFTEALGQPFVVENRAGSNGNVALDAFAKSAPDGYTLIVAADSHTTINPHLYAKMPMDPMKDLVPIAGLATNQFFLTINPQVQAKTLPEFVALAKAAKPPLAYGSAGNGSQHHLAIEMLKKCTGMPLTHAPYRGGTDAAKATMSGEVVAMMSGTSNAGPIRAGTLRAIAVSGKKRNTAFPDLPTIAEFCPGYEVSIWIAFFALKGTPEAIVERLHAETNKALADKDVVQKLDNAGGLDPMVVSRAELAATMKSSYEKYGAVVRELGVKIE
jgi:tripartite-type tricarboxylate transporter receptor subunit TctC